MNLTPLPLCDRAGNFSGVSSAFANVTGTVRNGTAGDDGMSGGTGSGEQHKWGWQQLCDC